MKKIITLIVSEEGTTLAEYAILISLITVIISTAISVFRVQIGDQFTRASNSLQAQ